VGRKTANVILNVAFGEPTIAVDTHVFRVANRTGLAPGRDPVEVEEKLEAVVPDEFRLHAHHWLILHGRYTCVAKVPRCPACVINDLCEFADKTRLVEPTHVARAVVKKAPAPKSPAAARNTVAKKAATRGPALKKPAAKKTARRAKA
jgi:adenine-specific DNA glycosylase